MGKDNWTSVGTTSGDQRIRSERELARHMLRKKISGVQRERNRGRNKTILINSKESFIVYPLFLKKL